MTHLSRELPVPAGSLLRMQMRPVGGMPAAGESPEPTLFESTSEELLFMLREQLGFATWVVARSKGEDWVAAIVEGDACEIRRGESLRWSDTLCARIAAGAGPRFVADLRLAPEHAQAPFAARFGIGAYLGVPLHGPDGRVLGSLCALDPQARGPIAPRELSMVEACARVLGRAMHADLCAAKLARRLEHAESVAFCDALTGLYNRRGWDQLLKAEESRCRRHGRIACVVSIDLDDLKAVNDTQGHERGDELLRKAARALRTTLRAHDVAARVGGDEFAVLAVDCVTDAVTALHARLAAALDAEEVRASVGVAMRTAATDLVHTWREADEAMYRSKRERKAASLSLTHR